MCSETLQPSQNPTVLNVRLTQRTITILQQENPLSSTIFQYLLAVVIKFQHSPTPFDGNYTSTIYTMVFDGQRYSQPAITSVYVVHQLSDIVPSVPEVCFDAYNTAVNLMLI